MTTEQVSRMLDLLTNVKNNEYSIEENVCIALDEESLELVSLCLELVDQYATNVIDILNSNLTLPIDDEYDAEKDTILGSLVGGIERKFQAAVALQEAINNVIKLRKQAQELR